MYPEKQRSNWWFLLPIFLGIIGGIIAYFVLRHDDPRKAKDCTITFGEVTPETERTGTVNGSSGQCQDPGVIFLLVPFEYFILGQV